MGIVSEVISFDNLTISLISGTLKPSEIGIIEKAIQNAKTHYERATIILNFYYEKKKLRYIESSGMGTGRSIFFRNASDNSNYASWHGILVFEEI